MATMEEILERKKQPFMDEFLFPWLRIPSVSSSPTNLADVRKAAEFLRDKLRELGFDSDLREIEDGNPAVYGHKHVGDELPTVLLYGHYDVQPPKDLATWVLKGEQLQPFDPVVRDGRLYARGAGDNKGHFSAAILGNMVLNEIGYPCNIKIIAEGNEEGGLFAQTHDIPPFFNFVLRNGELLRTDALLIFDTSSLQTHVPALTTRLKGIVKAQITSDDPVTLVELLHDLHDHGDNRVILPGFYDKVEGATIPADIEQRFGEAEETMGRIIIPEKGFSQLFHRWYRPTISPVRLTYANPNPMVSEDLQSVEITASGPKKILHSGEFGGPVAEPALNIAHLLAYLKNAGIKYEIDFIDYGSLDLSTAIEPKGTVQITVPGNLNIRYILDRVIEENGLPKELFEAKIVGRRAYLEKLKGKFDDQQRYHGGKPFMYLTFRMVLDQDPIAIYSKLEECVREDGADSKLLLTAEPFKSADRSDPYCAAVVNAFKEGFGTDVHEMALGGSIPVLPMFKQALPQGTPIILMGFVPPDANFHGGLENMYVDDIYRGALSYIRALQEIAKIRGS